MKTQGVWVPAFAGTTRLLKSSHGPVQVVLIRTVDLGGDDIANLQRTAA